MATRLQSLHHVPLLLRRDASEDRRTLHHVGELGWIVGKQLRVDRVVGALGPEPARDRTDGGRVIARDHLHGHALFAEVRERLRSVLPGTVAERDQCDRFQRGRQRLVRDRGVGALEQEHPAAERGLALGFRAQRIAGGQHHVRRAQHPRPVRVERRSAPLPGGGERHRLSRAPVLARTREALGDGGHRRVRVRVGGGEPRQGRLVGCAGVQSLDLLDREATLGERAGLVDAEDVHARETLHRGELLREHATAGQADHAHGERDAREQDEPLRHHGDGAGHGGRNGPAHALVRAQQLASEQQGRRRHDRVRDERQDAVDRGPELRAREGEPAGFLGQSHGVRGAAHAGGAVPARTRRYEGSRQHFVARRLQGRIRLAGQQGFVDLQPRGLERLAVHDDLVSRAEIQDVVQNHLRNGDLTLDTVAKDAGVRCRQHGEPVQRSLRPKLLHDPDQRVRDQHEAEQRVAELAHQQDHHEHRAEQGVEPGEQIRPDDLRDGPRGCGRHVVRSAGRDALGDLGRGQTPERFPLHLRRSLLAGRATAGPLASGTPAARLDRCGRC